MKRIWPLVLAIGLALAVFGGIYATRTPHVHADQPLLTEVNDASLAALRAEFNRASDHLRVILLLSPT